MQTHYEKRFCIAVVSDSPDKRCDRKILVKTWIVQVSRRRILIVLDVWRYSCALKCSQFIIHYIFFPCFVMWPQATSPFDLQTHSKYPTYAHGTHWCVITPLCARYSMNEKRKLVILFIHSSVWIFFRFRARLGIWNFVFCISMWPTKTMPNTLKISRILCVCIEFCICLLLRWVCSWAIV